MKHTSCLGKIIVFSVVSGFICLGIGYFVPLMLSPSNLGPLFGILVTGPVGVLAGAGVGLAFCSRETGRTGSKSLAIYWCAICGLALAYTVLLLQIAPRLGSGAVALLLILTICTAITGRHNEGDSVGFLARHRVPILFAMTLFFVSSLFPPVSAMSSETAGHVRMAFLWDPQLDASRRVAPLRIQTVVLLLEWAGIITAAGVMIATTGRYRRRAV